MSECFSENKMSRNSETKMLFLRSQNCRSRKYTYKCFSKNKMSQSSETKMLFTQLTVDLANIPHPKMWKIRLRLVKHKPVRPRKIDCVHRCAICLPV